MATKPTNSPRARKKHEQPLTDKPKRHPLAIAELED